MRYSSCLWEKTMLKSPVTALVMHPVVRDELLRPDHRSPVGVVRALPPSLRNNFPA